MIAQHFDYLANGLAAACRVFDDFPPDIMTMSFPGLWDLMKKAVSLRMLGRGDMMEILRIAPMCVASGSAVPISRDAGPYSPCSKTPTCDASRNVLSHPAM